MNPRLNFFKANPKTMAVLANLEQQIANSGLEKPDRAGTPACLADQWLCLLH